MVNYLFVRLELVRPNRASVERYSFGTFASQELLTIHEPHFIVLLPAAVSSGIGSETQKPLTIIVIGVLVTATSLILLFFQLQNPFRKVDFVNVFFDIAIGDLDFSIPFSE
ncbi:MAG: hypothetical protein EOO61_18110 [Hymenobacter sp.]|nr:MAG: hypothetical protein EOO61_18110 [Hymenobacter sp.]